jgi:hypothetical protein
MRQRASLPPGRPSRQGIRLITPLLASVILLAGCTAAGADNPAAGSVTTTPTGPSATDSAVPPAPSPVTSAAASSSVDASEPSAPTVTVAVVKLQPGVSDEASGIAASTGTPGAYFLVDDGTDTDAVAAVGSDGALLARIAVDGMFAGNAEALSSGTCGSTPLPDDAPADTCLYVGDIGDNAATRRDIAIYRFAEPELSTPPTDPVAAEEWRYSYPDGAQNAEAMLVDADGSLIIVTKPPAKGGLPHRMYRAEPGGGELVFIREFSPPAATRPFKTVFTGNVVTDLAAAPGRVLLLTYDDIQEYTAPDPAAELSTFPDWPHRPLPMPALSQAEGIAAMADGCGYAVASEAGPAGSAGSLGIASCG